MKDRWLPVGVLAGVLFAVNVAARLVARLGFNDDGEAQDRVSLGMFVAIGLILAVTAFLWGRRHPAGRWIADIGAAVIIAVLLTVFVGPFVSGDSPFESGAGDFFAQIWLYAAFAIGGSLVGFLILVALGLDYRSQGLKRYAEAKMAKPRRVVRR
ncbi:hypothetical protein [Phytohabitans houttuyneae]|uniref:Integral membrane protein n=1 Tax=Phytohabitans houttuyneae TaxID=1076126 RepID=A0A6V8K619_9ACTN|nr:hypothetical protein [Phytohabitans houttuyneae]GFJ80653.1 hypothetical protein Phou_048330 [Phytohabitans houttuyneae]